VWSLRSALQSLPKKVSAIITSLSLALLRVRMGCHNLPEDVRSRHKLPRELRLCNLATLNSQAMSTTMSLSIKRCRGCVTNLQMCLESMQSP